MRIHLQDMCQTDTTPFHQHWEARTQFPLDEIIASDEAFLNWRNNLHVGDQITILEYEKVGLKGADSEGIRAIARVRVADVLPMAVKLVSEGDIIRVEKPKVQEDEKPKGLVVKRIMPAQNDGYSFGAFDANDNMVERFRKKDEADSYAGLERAA